MNINYHTHTFRCHHAEKSEREYIESAIKNGFKILGFSDHAPYPFKDGYTSYFRMALSELENYTETLLNLREEYKKDIKILIGLETEYYPRHFKEFIDFIKPYNLDYLILGQHYTNNEYDGEASIFESDSVEKLETYVNQVIEGIKTKKFSYIAHPDVINFTGDIEIYKNYMKKLCVEAKQLNIPLECNFLGYKTHRNYPSRTFLELAYETKNDVILGIDAHDAKSFGETQLIEELEKFVKEIGIKPIEKLTLLKP